MKLKALTLREAARRAGVDYHQASRVLRGREHAPRVLIALETAVARAAMPKEVAA
jgi:DNA-binding LacI/PurR family transcriptional regulator